MEGEREMEELCKERKKDEDSEREKEGRSKKKKVRDVRVTQ